MKDEPKKTKIMSRSDMMDLANTHPDEVIRKVIRAILDNDVASLTSKFAITILVEIEAPTEDAAIERIRTMIGRWPVKEVMIWGAKGGPK